jgi:integrase/recombinase XerD
LGNKRNPGGLLTSFRAIHTFLHWTWDELELEIRNPISKLQAPKVLAESQPGIALENIQKMVEACTGTQAQWDRAVLLALLDSGARAFEILALKVRDIELLTGEIAIRREKGGKARVAFLGQRARKELRKNLKTRYGLVKGPPLFVTNEDTQLTYWGLRQILPRVAKRAGVPEPGAHDFPRAFCLAIPRQDVDLVTISRLIGHEDINLIRRYANQNNEDLRLAHQKACSVELLSTN